MRSFKNCGGGGELLCVRLVGDQCLGKDQVTSVNRNAGRASTLAGQLVVPLRVCAGGEFIRQGYRCYSTFH